MKKGTITPNGVVLHTHENATVVFLAEHGYDIELIPPIHKKGAKTPDIQMLGLDWEMKNPRSNGKYTIEHSFRSALRQSPNLIFVIRGSKFSEQKIIAEVLKRFHKYKRAKRVIIITKQRKLLDYNK